MSEPKTCDKCGRPILYPLTEPYNHTLLKRGHVEYATVHHDFYGCDSGCCGHTVRAFDCAGTEVWSVFEFSHPYHGEHQKWAEDLVADVLKHRVPVRFADCEISDD